MGGAPRRRGDSASQSWGQHPDKQGQPRWAGDMAPVALSRDGAPEVPWDGVLEMQGGAPKERGQSPDWGQHPNIQGKRPNIRMSPQHPGTEPQDMGTGPC